MADKQLRIIEERIKDHFYSAGYTEVHTGGNADHILNDLFTTTKELAYECHGIGHWGEDKLETHQSEVRDRLLAAEEVYAKRGTKAAPKELEAEFRKSLPERAKLLAIRFAARKREENKEIIHQLAKMNLLHLWQVPWVETTEARFAAVCRFDDDPANPIEAGTRIENALIVGLTEVQHQIKDAKDAKEDLKR